MRWVGLLCYCIPETFNAAQRVLIAGGGTNVEAIDWTVFVGLVKTAVAVLFVASIVSSGMIEFFKQGAESFSGESITVRPAVARWVGSLLAIIATMLTLALYFNWGWGLSIVTALVAAFGPELVHDGQGALRGAFSVLRKHKTSQPVSA